MKKSDGAICAGVLDWFHRMASIPHGSRQEQALSDTLKDWLTQLGGQVEQDALGNLRADFPPSPGCGGGTPVCVQGHLDMVCAVKPGGGYQPRTDPVQTVVEEGWLRSDGRSSLGADNNMGNAALLWLLSSGQSHGPLRVLFTVQEEIGLQGAMALNPQWLEGVTYVINTDGFQSDTLVLSSASGLRETWTRQITRTAPTKKQLCVMELKGFPGGHSGFDIAKDRPNPAILLCQRLRELGAAVQVGEIQAGSVHNAIPTFARALVWADGVEVLEQGLLDWYQRQIGDRPPEGILLTGVAQEPLTTAWSEETQTAVLDTVCGLFNGVDAWMTPEFPQVPLCSANLGAVCTQGETVSIRAFIRSADPQREAALIRQHEEIGQAHGFSKTSTYYPGWPLCRNNPLADLFAQVYRQETGAAVKIAASHVGLEPSVLLGKNPRLKLVNYGPDICDAHSVDERVRLDTLPVFVRVLSGVLTALAHQNGENAVN